MNTVNAKNKEEYSFTRNDLLKRNYSIKKEAVLSGRLVVEFEKTISNPLQRMAFLIAAFFASLFSCGFALRSKKIKEWKVQGKSGKKHVSLHCLFSQKMERKKGNQGITSLETSKQVDKKTLPPPSAESPLQKVISAEKPFDEAAAEEKEGDGQEKVELQGAFAKSSMESQVDENETLPPPSQEAIFIKTPFDEEPTQDLTAEEGEEEEEESDVQGGVELKGALEKSPMEIQVDKNETLPPPSAQSPQEAIFIEESDEATAEEKEDYVQEKEEVELEEASEKSSMKSTAENPPSDSFQTVLETLKFLYKDQSDWGKEENYTHLQRAARSGNLIECQRLLNDGISVSEIGPCKIPPLFLAALSGNIELCSFLFSKTTQEEQQKFLFSIVRDWHEHASRFLKNYKGLPELSHFAPIFALYESNKEAEALNLFNSLSFADKEEVLIISLIYSHIKSFNSLYKVAPREIRAFRDFGGEQKNSFLHLAISWNYAPVIEMLLEEKEIDILKVFNKDKNTPFHFAKKWQLDSALYSKLEEKDGGFSNDLYKCRLLGHYYDLKGPMLSGLLPHYLDPLPVQLATFLKKNLSLNPSGKLSGKTYSLAIEALENATNDLEIAWSRYSQGKMTLLLLGWEKHFVTAIISKDIFIKIDMEEPIAGALFYIIKNNDPRAIKEELKTLLHNSRYRISEDKGYNYFHHTLNEKLSLEQIYELSLNQNGAGSCGWKSLVGGCLALFHLEIRVRRGQPKELTLSIHDLIYALDEYYREALIETLPILKKYPEHFNLKEISSQIIHRCIYERFSSSLQALLQSDETLNKWQDEETGSSLLQLCYKEKKNWFNLENLFRILVEAKCETSLKDKNDQTILDDLMVRCEKPEEEAFRQKCLELVFS